MSTPSAPALPAPHRTPLGRGAVGVVWVGAVAGAIIGLVSLLGGGAVPRPAPPPGIVRLGQPIKTSFGTMSVDYVVRLTGARNPMGIPSAPGQLPIQIAVTLTNLQKRPLQYTPSMFEMPAIVTGGGVDPGFGLRGGKIPSLSAHRFQLRFAVPDAATLPRLTIHDPGSKRPVIVALGPSKGLGTLNVLDHHFSPDFAG